MNETMDSALGLAVGEAVVRYVTHRPCADHTELGRVAVQAVRDAGYAVVQLPEPDGERRAWAFATGKGLGMAFADRYYDGTPSVHVEIAEDGVHFEAERGPEIAGQILAAAQRATEMADAAGFARQEADDRAASPSTGDQT